jgi:Cdc6-like AAA superfamily ATPase
VLRVVSVVLTILSTGAEKDAFDGCRRVAESAEKNQKGEMTEPNSSVTMKTL